jgi:hypothetical protein
VLTHPFLSDVYDPNDKDIMVGEPLKKIDFEFECYSLNKEIIRELLLDEIIMINSKEAKKAYQNLLK